MTHPTPSYGSYYDSSICNAEWPDYHACALTHDHRGPHKCPCGKTKERESNGTSQQT